MHCAVYVLSLIIEEMNIIIGQQTAPLLPHPIPAPLVPAPMSSLVVLMVLVSQDGESPLWIASINGQLHVVKTLIEAGANVNNT